MFDAQMGYTMANSVDAIINQLLKSYPLDKRENLRGWMAFLRTIETSANVLSSNLDVQLEGIVREEIKE